MVNVLEFVFSRSYWLIELIGRGLEYNGIKDNQKWCFKGQQTDEAGQE